ncbi:glutamate--tRNA ligase [soil metagenome]
MSQLNPIKTRFCPSPTGHIHLGNVRAALFSALFAKHKEGKFLLRIEDTDKSRSSDEFTQLLMQELRWLGLDWQEGPEVGGDHAPYWQSQRQPLYDQFYLQLQEKNLCYACFCTEQQLTLQRKLQRAAGKPPRYAGTCRSLTVEQVQAKEAQGLTSTLRFAVPKGQLIQFEDLVHGQQCFNSDDLGDFVIRRADGTAPFLFSNSIDDALMEVTHVLRGVDHLANTPRQMLILQALQLPLSAYGHFGLILGADGAPLSKRNGSRSVKELREEGYIAEAVINYMARLGHTYNNNHYMTFVELAKDFSVDSLSRSPSRFDLSQLLFWQKAAVAHHSDDFLWEWMGKDVQAQVPAAYQQRFITTVKPNVVFPTDALHWATILFADEFVFNEKQQEILTQAGAEFFQETLLAVTEHGLDSAKIISVIQEKLQLKGKALFMPLRVALTGEGHGPELAGLLDLLGLERVKRRLQAASQIL